MLHGPIQLYRNAYSGLSRQVWWLALVMFSTAAVPWLFPFLLCTLPQRDIRLHRLGMLWQHLDAVQFWVVI